MSISATGSNNITPTGDMFSEFDGKVRMDEESQRFSVLDIISVMTCSDDRGNNNRLYKRVLDQHPFVQESVSKLRINGQVRSPA